MYVFEAFVDVEKELFSNPKNTVSVTGLSIPNAQFKLSIFNVYLAAAACNVLQRVL
jgi:hypothetical protein